MLYSVVGLFVRA